MEIRASSITFRCGAPNCTASQTTDFELSTEVVDFENQGWHLPKGWREEEADTGDGIIHIICCPAHTVESEPVFKPHVVVNGDPNLHRT